MMLGLAIQWNDELDRTSSISKFDWLALNWMRGIQSHQSGAGKEMKRRRKSGGVWYLARISEWRSRCRCCTWRSSGRGWVRTAGCTPASDSRCAPPRCRHPSPGHRAPSRSTATRPGPKWRSSGRRSRRWAPRTRLLRNKPINTRGEIRRRRRRRRRRGGGWVVESIPWRFIRAWDYREGFRFREWARSRDIAVRPEVCKRNENRRST